MKIVMRKLTPPALRVRAMYEPLVRVVRDMGPEMEKDLKEITKTWEKPVVFDVRTHATIGRNRLDVTVETEDERFIWVSEGTKSHMVPKKGVATMAFRKYKAKTRVLWVGSVPGGRYGPIIVRRGRWRVSGIKARHYDIALAERYQAIMERRVYDAMTNEVIALSGHGL